MPLSARVMAKFYIMSDHSVKTPPSALDETWTLAKIQKELKIDIVRREKQELEFDIIGAFPALVNAFRRILISEVPTMAIEKVTIAQNKTVMQDEVLAHRLGLIPLKANPNLFDFRLPGDTIGTDRDTLNYEINVKCTKNPNCRPGKFLPEEMYINHQVLSKDIKWIPMKGQERLYKEEDVGPVHDDIVILKMRPGHELSVKMTAVKGIGQDHAKFSPVGTASYRLFPYICLREEISGERAQRLQKCFSPGVVELIEKSRGNVVAVVRNPRLDMCSRNVLNDPDLRDKVDIGRVKDHFIFSIESVSNTEPEKLFREAVKILKKKCTDALTEAKKVKEIS